jgi:hypothetical protein
MKVTSNGGYEIGVNNTNSLDIWNLIFYNKIFFICVQI